MVVGDKVVVVSDCADFGRTGVVTAINQDWWPLTHDVKLDDPTPMDELLANFFDRDTVEYAESELKPI